VNFCMLCNGPIRDGENWDPQIIGWQRQAVGKSRRGGSDIVGREHTGRVAHSRCVDRERRGVSAQQGQLV
jgi:hypothetical protein